MIDLVHFSELLGGIKLLHIFEIFDVSDNMQIVLIATRAQQVVSDGHNLRPLVIFVEVSNFLLEALDQIQLLEPHVIELVSQ